MGRKRAFTLAELETDFSGLSARASALMQSAGTEKALRRPKEGSWSAVECLEHLNLSAARYFPLWDDAIPKASRRDGPPDKPYRMDFWGGILLWALEPPPRMRMPTSKPFMPALDLDPARTLQSFLEGQRHIQNTMKACERFAIDKVKIPSPFDSRVRYSVWSSFVVTAAHERRHLWQAERALALS